MPSLDYCLFYTAPCLSTEAWAAWAQALLSAAAIVAAATIATSQERRQLGRRGDAYVSLIDSADESVGRVLQAAKGGYFEFQAAADRELPRLQKMAQAFDSVDLADVPDFRFVPLIHDVGEGCKRVSDLIGKARTFSHLPGDDGYLAPIAAEKAHIIQWYEYAIEVANEYSNPTIRQRIKRLMLSFPRAI